MNKTRGENRALIRFTFRVCLGISVVAAIFTLTVAVLLVLNHQRTQSADPLNSAALADLRQELRGNPENSDLREQVRQLDLLARRAYYTSVSFSGTGAWLLLAGSVILLISLKTLRTLARKRPRPGPKGKPDDEKRVAALARWLVVSVGAGVVAVSLVILYLYPAPPFPVESSYDSLPPAAVVEEILPVSERPEETPEDQKTSSPGSGSPDAGEELKGPELSPSALEEHAPAVVSRNSETPAAAETELSLAPSHLWEKRKEHWPTFRGPDGLGLATAQDAPVNWDGGSGENVQWKVPVPLPGFSSPVVWDHRLFITGADSRVREVYCYDTRTGSLLWKHAVKGIPGSPANASEVTQDTGYAASSMAVDGTRAYAVFSSGDLVALDLEGNRVWARNLGLPDNPYGYASSLMTYKELLIVQYDQWEHSKVMALDGSTGKVVWERPREMEISWTSPILIDDSGQVQLVLSGNPYVTGYDPDTGRQLWQIECMSGEVASSPGYAAGLVFAANEYAKLCAIRPGPEPAVDWEYEEGLPEVASTLATGERVYMANGVGTVTCLDQKTGRMLWEHEFDEGFYASPVLVRDRVYLMDRMGVMRIIRDSGTFELVSSPALGEESTCTAAFTGGRIFIRGFANLFGIQNSR